MIDWISAILPVGEKIAGGHTLRVSPDGEVETSQVRPLQVVGSFSSSATVCNVAMARKLRGEPLTNVNIIPTFVYISGNPSKWLQGHNIYGTNDLKSLAPRWFEAIALALGFSAYVAARWHHIGLSGRYELTRIDITESFRVGSSNKDVSEWIFNAHKNARVSHKQAQLDGGNTLYFGKHSRRHQIKLYNKWMELLKHPIDSQLKEHEEMMLEDASNLLRVEVMYRARKLREMGFDMAHKIDKGMIERLYEDSIKGLRISEQIKNYEVTRENVGKGAYTSYLAWLAGENLNHVLAHNTFYRHRRSLLPYGIDISLPCEQKPVSRVVPLVRVLEAKQVSVPQWYHDRGLIAA